MTKKEVPASETIATNRKARFEYEILETYEAGIVLTGSEVKSLRLGKANIEAAYANVSDGEIWLYNCNISEYKQANKLNHLPTRPRKLLLHKSEVRKLIGKLKEQGLTLAPLELFFNKRGIAKLRIGLAKGKKLHDKRESIKKRDWERSKQRKDYD